MKPSPFVSPAPFKGPLSTRVSVPGSKSHTNRALMTAALAEGKTTLENVLFSDDTHHFSKALKELGFQVQAKPAAKQMTITGLGGRIPAAQADLFIGNAGTAVRFLTAMLTLGQGQYRLDGIERMRQRPIGDLVVALNNLGARVEGTGSTGQDRSDLSWISSRQLECPPVTIHANGLRGGKTSIRGDVSSQFLSGLLMAAPYAEQGVEISVEAPLHSKPYIDLTIGVMADFGVGCQREGYRHFQISAQKYRSPGSYQIESDATAASYFFAAAAICGGWVEVTGINRQSRQGDIGFLDLLARMGCAISETPTGLRVTGTAELGGLDVDMSDISDTAITLAVVAPFVNSPTTIRGIASSRLKETDRIAATCTELRRLGVRVEEHPDGMTIFPCDDLRPASIRTYDDHRMAMAFSLIGLRLPGIKIHNPSCVAKTFPKYFEVLESLR